LIVVSNTSPLTNLAAIGQFELLYRLFGSVNVASAVIDELAYDDISWPGLAEAKNAAWIRVQTVTSRQLVDALRIDLDRGEAETIVLGLELGADLVLLDERAGRYVAQHMGLNVMGVGGLLLRAKSLGIIPAIRPLLDALREQAGFYLSRAVYEQILIQAGEINPLD
jgi:predicted nucleic acid-binding protein